MQNSTSVREELESFVEEEKRQVIEKEKKVQRLKKIETKGNVISIKFSDKVDGSA